ncbi:MAG: membrane protein insertase YidC [Chlamydiia bacterium]
MDKRQLVLVAIFAASLFAVQTYFKPTAVVQTVVTPPPPVPREREKRYVLETPLQQVVFSNLGGSIAELNLRLHGSNGSESVVKPVEADRKLAEQDPRNARFPLLPSLQFDPATGRLREISEGTLGGYYPLLRRGNLGPNGELTGVVRPEYYALSLSKVDGVFTQPFAVKEISDHHIRFEWSDGANQIIRTYELGRPPLTDAYLLKARIETVGAVGPLWVSSGIPEVELVGGSPDPRMQYAVNRSGTVDVEKLDLPKDQVSVSSLYPQWLSTSNGFFGLILDPQSEIGPGFRVQQLSSKEAPSRIELIPGQGTDFPGYRYFLPLSSRAGSTDLAFYAGPLESNTLRAADQAIVTLRNGQADQNPQLQEVMAYYGFFSFVSAPFARFMWWLMQAFYAFCGSWGFSVILLTIALRVITWPLTQWSAKATAKGKALEPEIAELRKKFEKQPQLFKMAQIELYREKGFNPFSALLPMLIQIPLLLGMLDLLRSSFPLRGASFIPGWIPDLAAPDVVFSWGFHIPWIGSSLHLLPIILAGITFLQTRMGAGAPTTADSSPEHRQKMIMGTVFPLILLFAFYSAPSGLNLYWLFSTVLSIVQQAWADRRAAKTLTSPKVVPLNRR